MEGNRLLIVLALALGVAGCGRQSPPPFPNWVPEHASYSPSASSNNAFDLDALAAEAVERADPKLLKRAFFDGAYRAKASEAAAPGIRLLERAFAKPCDFKFAPTAPFEAAPHQLGWRLLGRVLVWQIEAAVREKNYSQAVNRFLVATKFGLDIMGGGVSDALLGMSIARDSRIALLVGVPLMGSGDLKTLSAGLIRIHQGFPAATNTLRNERENMLAAVQVVQNAFRDNRLQWLLIQTGATAKKAVDYLEKLREDGPEARVKYFEQFAADAKARSEKFEELAAKRWSERIELATTEAEMAKKNPKPVKPWGRFAPHFFNASRYFIDEYDQVLARTRLLAVYAGLASQAKLGSLPENLESFDEDLRSDPFSHADLAYTRSGLDFKVYSVGPNGRDDGGESGPDWFEPDLVLEFK